MNFFIGGRCQPIRHGNPSVLIDPNFISMTDLHILDLSDTNATSVVQINVEQTYGGDWLLETAVQDEVCATFPSPYEIMTTVAAIQLTPTTPPRGSPPTSPC